MDHSKLVELQIALSELSTVQGLRESARNILKGMARFEPTVDSYSMSDIKLLEHQNGRTFPRRGN